MTATQTDHLANATYPASLLTDAKLVADYGRRAGLFSDGLLYQAIARVELLAESSRLAFAPEVIELQKAMDKASRVVPFATLAALMQGWRPENNTVSRLRLVLLLMISLIMMIMIVTFSQINNRGVALLSDLKSISVANPIQQYDDLVRQLVDTRTKIDLTKTGEAGELEIKSYFQNFDRLKTLDSTLVDISNRYTQLVDQTDGISAAFYKFLAIFGFGNRHSRELIARYESYNQTIPFSDFYKENPPSADTQFISVDMKSGPIYCSFLESDNDFVSKRVEFLRSKLGMTGGFPDKVRTISMETSYLRCFEKLLFRPDGINFETWMRDIRHRLLPYTLWLLPSLFGAVGAVIFYLRVIGDPLQPNPSGFKVVHRIAFGALAGVVLAWFWLPEVRFGVEIPDVGFGLFAMAFLAGFSLDVFFELLDRLVRLAGTAVGGIGGKPTVDS